ncbi:sulfatase family protein [Aestuariimicrobium kwangyangense]|uniref:sulfatase family protein n=1 Tax=Aestuariimicrobium kwangyangense TaxID=396389 RepID=UPI0003B49121|nr:sulfatase-like hydrolase/transferase [Aestuariimicrobium kwangyangense]
MSRPNILLILSDDHGWADRGSRSPAGGEAFATPHLDRLAAEGTTLDEAYVTAPICSPSRAGLISGRHQARWGARWFESSSFPTSGPTLAERLHDLGYSTGYFGKVHYGSTDDPGTRPCPPHHGFDESLYALAKFHLGRLNYLHRGADDVAAYGQAAGPMGVGTLWEGDEQVAPPGFLTDLWAERADRFIDDHADDEDPFFCMVAFNAVHNFCWQLPADELRKRGLPAAADWHPGDQPYEEWYDDAIAPNLEHGREYYLAQLELMDAAIGRLLDRLDQRGLADDTIVVYLTDNGGSTCNYGDNGPLRGTKYTLFEGGIRVPYIVRWPAGGVPAGEVRDGLASSLDLVPTLVAAAGGSVDETDGRDLVPLLTGAGTGHDELHWDAGFQWAVRSGRWKLSWCDPDAPAAHQLRATEHAPLGSGYLLADLETDIGEQRDLSGERPEVFDDLLARHERWAADIAST